MAKVINLAERREQKIQKQLHSPMQGWIVWLKCPKCETREYSELRMPEGRIHKCGTMVEEHEVEIDIRAELTVSLRNSELISELLAKSNAKGIMKKFLKSGRAMLEHLERSEEEYRKRLQLMSQQECTPILKNGTLKKRDSRSKNGPPGTATHRGPSTGTLLPGRILNSCRSLLRWNDWSRNFPLPRHRP